MWTLGALALAFVWMGVVSFVPSNVSVAATSVASHDVEEATPEQRCDDDCPGELPDGDCPDNCQHCGCGSSFAPSMTSVGVTMHPAASLAWLDVPPPLSLMPTDIARGIFKPPQHLSV